MELIRTGSPLFKTVRKSQFAGVGRGIGRKRTRVDRGARDVGDGVGVGRSRRTRDLRARTAGWRHRDARRDSRTSGGRRRAGAPRTVIRVASSRLGRSWRGAHDSTESVVRVNISGAHSHTAYTHTHDIKQTAVTRAITIGRNHGDNGQPSGTLDSHTSRATEYRTALRPSQCTCLRTPLEGGAQDPRARSPQPPVRPSLG